MTTFDTIQVTQRQISIPEYRGYHAEVRLDSEAQQFHGMIAGIGDYVNFISGADEGMSGIIREFHSAVDDYLEFCREVGKSPATSSLQAG